MRKNVLVFALVLGVCLTGRSIPAAETAAGGNAPPISAAVLRKAFADNQDEAERRYVGQTVTVTGVVLSTGMSIYLTPNVLLSDREEGPVQVVCVLPRADVGKLSHFRAGRKTALRGRVYRLSERGVVLKECVAVDMRPL